MTQEPNIPKAILAKAQRLAPVFEDYFPKGSIKMGGGTILQARWQHRISTDADFFVFPQEFNKVVGERGGELESSIYALSGVNTHRSWVELTAIYCEMDGIELTVMPSEPLFRESSGHVVPGTGIETETSATILSKKIIHRMVQAGSVEVRDLYDVFASISFDSHALERALAPIRAEQLAEIVALLKVVPESWLADTTKPLIGVDSPPSHSELALKVCDFLQRRIDRLLGR